MLNPGETLPPEEPDVDPGTPLDPGPVAPPKEPPPIPRRPRPVSEGDRFQSLDVVRGIALIGILLVNIEHFAMVRGARYDPTISGGDEPIHHAIWLVKMLFADTKFLTMFTLLFGAGLALMDDRRRRFGEWKAIAIYYRRIVFLLLLGVAHGLFLWRGDILYLYASCALILYFVPRFPSVILMPVALLLLAHYVYDFGDYLATQFSRYQWWEREIYGNLSWHDQFEYRWESEEYFIWKQPFEAGSFVIGAMIFGMAALKTRFLTGEWRAWVYALIALPALAAGTWLVYRGHGTEAGFETEPAARLFLIGSLVLALGYICVGILLARFLGSTLPIRALASFGRMALTNYLLQSVICTTIFYSYGLALYEKTNRLQQLYVVAAVVAFQIVFSHLWLMVFRFGPFEWIWRTVSYFRFQPILKERPAARDPQAAGTEVGSLEPPSTHQDEDEEASADETEDPERNHPVNPVNPAQ